MLKRLKLFCISLIVVILLLPLSFPSSILHFNVVNSYQYNYSNVSFLTNTEHDYTSPPLQVEDRVEGSPDFEYVTPPSSSHTDSVTETFFLNTEDEFFFDIEYWIETNWSSPDGKHNVVNLNSTNIEDEILFLTFFTADGNEHYYEHKMHQLFNFHNHENAIKGDHTTNNKIEHLSLTHIYCDIIGENPTSLNKITSVEVVRPIIKINFTTETNAWNYWKGTYSYDFNFSFSLNDEVLTEDYIEKSTSLSHNDSWLDGPTSQSRVVLSSSSTSTHQIDSSSFIVQPIEIDRVPMTPEQYNSFISPTEELLESLAILIGLTDGLTDEEGYKIESVNPITSNTSLSIKVSAPKNKDTSIIRDLYGSEGVVYTTLAIPIKVLDVSSLFILSKSYENGSYYNFELGPTSPRFYSTNSTPSFAFLWNYEFIDALNSFHVDVKTDPSVISHIVDKFNLNKYSSYWYNLLFGSPPKEFKSTTQWSTSISGLGESNKGYNISDSVFYFPVPDDYTELTSSSSEYSLNFLNISYDTQFTLPFSILIDFSDNQNSKYGQKISQNPTGFTMSFIGSFEPLSLDDKITYQGLNTGVMMDHSFLKVGETSVHLQSSYGYSYQYIPGIYRDPSFPDKLLFEEPNESNYDIHMRFPLYLEGPESSTQETLDPTHYMMDLSFPDDFQNDNIFFSGTIDNPTRNVSLQEIVDSSRYWINDTEYDSFKTYFEKDLSSDLSLSTAEHIQTNHIRYVFDESLHLVVNPYLDLGDNLLANDEKSIQDFWTKIDSQNLEMVNQQLPLSPDAKFPFSIASVSITTPDGETALGGQKWSNQADAPTDSLYSLTSKGWPEQLGLFGYDENLVPSSSSIISTGINAVEITPMKQASTQEEGFNTKKLIEINNTPPTYNSSFPPSQETLIEHTVIDDSGSPVTTLIPYYEFLDPTTITSISQTISGTNLKSIEQSAWQDGEFVSQVNRSDNPIPDVSTGTYSWSLDSNYYGAVFYSLSFGSNSNHEFITNYQTLSSSSVNVYAPTTPQSSPYTFADYVSKSDSSFTFNGVSFTTYTSSTELISNNVTMDSSSLLMFSGYQMNESGSMSIEWSPFILGSEQSISSPHLDFADKDNFASEADYYFQTPALTWTHNHSHSYPINWENTKYSNLDPGLYMFSNRSKINGEINVEYIYITDVENYTSDGYSFDLEHLDNNNSYIGDGYMFNNEFLELIISSSPGTSFDSLHEELKQIAESNNDLQKQTYELLFDYLNLEYEKDQFVSQESPILDFYISEIQHIYSETNYFELHSIINKNEYILFPHKDLHTTSGAVTEWDFVSLKAAWDSKIFFFENAPENFYTPREYFALFDLETTSPPLDFKDYDSFESSYNSSREWMNLDETDVLYLQYGSYENKLNSYHQYIETYHHQLDYYDATIELAKSDWNEASANEESNVQTLFDVLNEYPPDSPILTTANILIEDYLVIPNNLSNGTYDLSSSVDRFLPHWLLSSFYSDSITIKETRSGFGSYYNDSLTNWDLTPWHVGTTQVVTVGSQENLTTIVTVSVVFNTSTNTFQTYDHQNTLIDVEQRVDVPNGNNNVLTGDMYFLESHFEDVDMYNYRVTKTIEDNLGGSWDDIWDEVEDFEPPSSPPKPPVIEKPHSPEGGVVGPEDSIVIITPEVVSPVYPTTSSITIVSVTAAVSSTITTLVLAAVWIRRTKSKIIK